MSLVAPRLRVSVLLVAATAAASANADHPVDYARVLREVARDIAALKSEYPQLAAFDPATSSSGEAAKITYQFHTHAPPRSGGWTSGVPNPDGDGVWFYIDFHDADSTLQIHTQPMTAVQCLGEKRVSFLIMEGDATRHVEGAIEKILRDHGVGRCMRPHHAGGPNARIS